MNKVILVDIINPRVSKKQAGDRMIESENLVNTYGWFVIIKKIQRKVVPDYETYIWKWKLEEIRSDALETWAKLIIINNNLKTKQLFNIERFLEKDSIKIWTRVDLILKIFEKHATTLESRLQIELAAIRQLWPRIFWMWLELSKLAWWIWTRWKWETNTEIMKRHLALKEKRVKDKLKKIWNRHELYRKNRERKWLNTVAIVWYTNAWKSQTLLALTWKQVKIKDELFATLDTRIWDLFLPKLQKKCLISDTIWFIQDLPPDLIDAFKSTLDETLHADLILHVIDYSDSQKEKKIKIVHEILENIWVSGKQIIFVCNKIDLIKTLKTKTFFKKYKRFNPCAISAIDKTWIKQLVNIIEKSLSNNV